MAKAGLWTTAMQQRDEKLRAIRNDLIVKLAKDKLGYGPLSHSEIERVLRTSQASVSRLIKKGRNSSRPAAST